MIFALQNKRKQDVKTVFDKAWEITSSWEGDYNSGGGGAGNKFNGIIYGTQYGITAEFAQNFCGVKLSNNKVIKNLSEDTCKGYWKNVVWDKMILGDKIKDEKVAMLLFDSCVHLQSHLNEFPDKGPKGDKPIKSWIRGFIIKFLCNEGGIPEATNKESDQTKYTKRVTIKTYFNPKCTNPTDKASVLTPEAIELINLRCGMDARGFFNRLNAARKIAESGWDAQNRLKAFTYDKITPNTISRKFYNEFVNNREILFFTQKGCKPCLELKPTCEALAQQNNFHFQEVDIRTDAGKILMTQYRIGATPEVVLIHGDTTVSFGAADLFDYKLALYLSNLTKTVPIEPTVQPTAQAQSDSNWVLPLAAGAFAWYHFKGKKRIGNADDNQNLAIGGGLLLLWWWFSGESGSSLSNDLDWMMNLMLQNEGKWEAETAHTRKDSGNYHKGEGQFLGTSYGVTADFLEQWYGTKTFEPNSIKNITEEQAKKIWVETVMAHARVPEVKDKYVAALYFDWMVHRPGTCLEYLMTKMYKLSQSDWTAAKRGYYAKSGVTDNVIALLNQGAAKDCFETLKGWRLHHLENTSVYASFREGVRNRINRYQYGM
jgi:lysozyme family protein/thiol-disulfide isomerase/thioredoxin